MSTIKQRNLKQGLIFPYCAEKRVVKSIIRGNLVFLALWVDLNYPFLIFMKKLTLLILTVFFTFSASFADPVNLTFTLKLGSSDEVTNGEVSKLQNFLYPKYLKVTSNGYFGFKTQQAVKDFQKANGLSAVGQVGVMTRAKIKEISSIVQQTTTPQTSVPVSSNNSQGDWITYPDGKMFNTKTYELKLTDEAKAKLLQQNQNTYTQPVTQNQYVQPIYTQPVQSTSVVATKPSLYISQGDVKLKEFFSYGVVPPPAVIIDFGLRNPSTEVIEITSIEYTLTSDISTNSNDKISIGFKNTPLTETTLGSAIGQKSRIDFPTPLRLFANEDPFLEFYYPLQGTTPGTGGLTLSNGTPVVNVTVNSITTKSGVMTKDLPITNTYVYRR